LENGRELKGYSSHRILRSIPGPFPEILGVERTGRRRPMDPKTILISFQQDGATGSLSTLLNRLGYRTQSAKVVSDMIRKVRSGEIHVLLLDEEIEGVKAYDLVPVFKRINARIQVIVVSSDSSLGPVRRLREGGIFYQAMKPIDLEEIKAAVVCAFQKIERESLGREFSFPFVPRTVAV